MPSSISKSNCNKILQNATYTLEVLYPQTQDPRLFLVILEQLQRTLNTRKDTPTYKQINRLLTEHKISPTEIKTTEKIVIYTKNYKKQSTITAHTINQLLNATKKIIDNQKQPHPIPKTEKHK